MSALGDLMLSGQWELERRAPGSEPLAALARELRGDLVFANLESAVESGAQIAKEPRIVAKPETIVDCLDALAIVVVNLANNHVFDALSPGYLKLRELLEKRSVHAIGAGTNAAAAARPCELERDGISFGWLGYVSRDTMPTHVAQESQCGANPLDFERALSEVSELRERVDHVLVSLHWGVEYCHLPSPEQVCFARALVEAGASVVLGHHVHVLQGVERYGNGVIAYSLGNATTTDHYVGSRLAIRQTPRTCSSAVLRVTFSKQAIEAFETLPIRCEGARILVGDAVAGRYLRRANRYLDRGITPALWRRRRLIEDVGLRTLRKLHPSVIRSVRPSHVIKFFRNSSRSLRGLGPVA
jgi:poly-gamma-glutamate synthesis protein (capsule biosynthesis protein)